MTHRSVASNAVQSLRAVSETIDFLNNFAVTIAACAFGHLTITRSDLNIVGEEPGGKSIGMMHAIHRFYPVFSEKIMGSMAVIANGNSLVTGFNPAVVVLLHHMAIGACFRIIVHVGQSFGIKERVGSYSETKTRRNAEEKGCVKKTPQPGMLKKVSHGVRLHSDLSYYYLTDHI